MSLTGECHPSPDAVRRLGGVTATACVLLAAAAPAYVILAWATHSPASLVEARLSPVSVSALTLGGQVAPWQRIVGAAAGLAPALTLSWGLLQARRALKAISLGHFFAPEVPTGLRGYAVASLWAAILSFLITPLLSVALTLGNPPGERILSLGLSSGQVFAVLSAGIFWVIAAALARGVSLEREHAQFV